MATTNNPFAMKLADLVEDTKFRMLLLDDLSFGLAPDIWERMAIRRDIGALRENIEALIERTGHGVSDDEEWI